MFKRIFILGLLIGLFLAFGSHPAAKTKPEKGKTESTYPSTGQQCTSFYIDNGDYCAFGTNLDHGTLQDGQIFVNKRNVLKTGWEPSASGEYARWISNYGSVTINIIGPQLVWGGMNEAGLMVSTMSLLETEQSPADERPPLTSGFWIQYILDNFSSVEEVIASDKSVRTTDQFDHYLVCDAMGDCAVIEFLEGKTVSYSSSSLPVSALSNSTYQDSLAALEDGNYWKVTARGVNPDGPAAQAGMLENDWIISVNDNELSGPESLANFHAVIAKHDPGDELELTLLHLGDSDPVTVTLKMGPLPEDLSKYILPPAVPVQVLSLGFIPIYPGDFLVRFDTAAKWVRAYESIASQDSVTYAFDGLKAVAMDDTVLSAVFDPKNMQVYFHTNQNPNIRYINFEKLDFSCKTPVMMMDMHTGAAGDVSGELMKYSHELEMEYSLPIVTNLWQVDISKLYAETVLGGFEKFPCMEDKPSAMQNPDLYLENHSPLLPPLVLWTVMMVIEKFWFVLVILILIFMAFIMWRLKQRRQVAANKY